MVQTSALLQRFIAWLETLDQAPSNNEICMWGGWKSWASAARIVKICETRGLITVERGSNSRLIVIVASGRRLKSFFLSAERGHLPRVASAADLGLGREKTTPRLVSVTSDIMGDPAPGRSALDRKRAGQ